MHKNIRIRSRLSFLWVCVGSSVVVIQYPTLPIMARAAAAADPFAAYEKSVTPEVLPLYQQTLSTIRAAATETTDVSERVSWGMPCWRVGDKHAFGLGAFKHHVAILSPMTSIVSALAPEITAAGCTFTKGGVQITPAQVGKAFPNALIRKVVLGAFQDRVAQTTSQQTKKGAVSPSKGARKSTEAKAASGKKSVAAAKSTKADHSTPPAGAFRRTMIKAAKTGGGKKRRTAAADA